MNSKVYTDAILLRQGKFVNELRGKAMEIKQINSTIKSRAAVAFAPNQPLQIVEIRLSALCGRTSSDCGCA